MSGFTLRMIVLALLLGATAAVLAIRLTAAPAPVPCAHWTPGHIWCQGPAGVTPI